MGVEVLSFEQGEIDKRSLSISLLSNSEIDIPSEFPERKIEPGRRNDQGKSRKLKSKLPVEGRVKSKILFKLPCRAEGGK